MKKHLFFLFLFLIHTTCVALPKGFVYLNDIAPEIMQDMRYATINNFIGTPIPGYTDRTCIISLAAAKQLQKAQQDIKKQGYRLKVYDCYRPQKAVDYFYSWSQIHQLDTNKPKFYPREKKDTLFDKGYIAHSSGHTRGSTVDLTLVKIKKSSQKTITKPLVRCFDTSPHYLDDNSIDMGTRFDCLDPSANIDYPHLSHRQKNNRKLLHNLMIRYGFTPYVHEWWHFTLANEPFPTTYFNFPVKK